MISRDVFILLQKRGVAVLSIFGSEVDISFPVRTVPFKPNHDLFEEFSHPCDVIGSAQYAQYNHRTAGMTVSASKPNPSFSVSVSQKLRQKSVWIQDHTAIPI